MSGQFWSDIRDIIREEANKIQEKRKKRKENSYFTIKIAKNGKQKATEPEERLSN